MKKSTLILLLPFFLVACSDSVTSEPSTTVPNIEEAVTEKEMIEESIETELLNEAKRLEEAIKNVEMEEARLMEEEASTEEGKTVDSDWVAEPIKEVDQTAKYQDYDQEIFDALEGKQNMLLFFHASWCPTCAKWEAMVKENLDSLPENTVILKLDYDNSTDLKKKYGITTQSTGVFVSVDGTTNKQADPSIETISSFFDQ